MSSRRTDAFIATETDGTEHQIVVWTDYTMNGSQEIESGEKQMRTALGEDVSPIAGSGNRLQILRGINWISLTTTDPRYQNL